MSHIKLGGTRAVDNYGILFWSCHYSAHEGGDYLRSTVESSAEDYEFFNGPDSGPGLRSAWRTGRCSLIANSVAMTANPVDNPMKQKTA
jgi:hypothetical protein